MDDEARARPQRPKGPPPAHIQGNRRAVASAPSSGEQPPAPLQQQQPRPPQVMTLRQQQAEAAVFHKVNPRHALAQLLRDSADYAEATRARAGSKPFGPVIHGHSASSTSSSPAAAMAAQRPASGGGGANHARVTATMLRQLKAVQTAAELEALEGELRAMVAGNETRLRSSLYSAKLTLICRDEEQKFIAADEATGRRRIEAEERAAREVGSGGSSSEARALAVLCFLFGESSARAALQAEYPPAALVAAHRATAASVLLADREKGPVAANLARSEALQRAEVVARRGIVVAASKDAQRDRDRCRAWLDVALGTAHVQRAVRGQVEAAEAAARGAAAIDEGDRRAAIVELALKQRRHVLGRDAAGLETITRARIELDEENDFGGLLYGHRRGARTAVAAAARRGLAQREELLRWQAQQEEAIRWQKIATWAARRWYEMYHDALLGAEATKFAVHDEACGRRDLLEERRTALEALSLAEGERRRAIGRRDGDRARLLAECVQGRVALMQVEAQQREHLVGAREPAARHFAGQRHDVGRLVDVEGRVRAAIASDGLVGASRAPLALRAAQLAVEAEEDRERRTLERESAARIAVAARPTKRALAGLSRDVPGDERDGRAEIEGAEEATWGIFLAHAAAVAGGGGPALETRLLQAFETKVRVRATFGADYDIATDVLLPACAELEALRRAAVERHQERAWLEDRAGLVAAIEAARRDDLAARWHREWFSLAKAESIAPQEGLARAQFVVALEEDARRLLFILFRHCSPMFKAESARWDVEEAESEQRMLVESAAELSAATQLGLAIRDLYPWTLGRADHLRGLSETRPVEYVTVRSVTQEHGERSVAGRADAVAFVHHPRDVLKATRPVCVTFGTFLLEMLLDAQHSEGAERETVAALEACGRALLECERKERARRLGLIAHQAQLWEMSLQAITRVSQRAADAAGRAVQDRILAAEQDSRRELWIRARAEMLGFLSTRDAEEQERADAAAAALRTRVLVWQGPLLDAMYEERRALAQAEFDAFEDLRLGRAVGAFEHARDAADAADDAALAAHGADPRDIAGAMLPTATYYQHRRAAPGASGRETAAAGRHGYALESAAELLRQSYRARDLLDREENDEYRRLYGECRLTMGLADHRREERVHLHALLAELRENLAQFAGGADAPAAAAMAGAAAAADADSAAAARDLCGAEGAARDAIEEESLADLATLLEERSRTRPLPAKAPTATATTATARTSESTPTPAASEIADAAEEADEPVPRESDEGVPPAAAPPGRCVWVESLSADYRHLEDLAYITAIVAGAEPSTVAVDAEAPVTFALRLSVTPASFLFPPTTTMFLATLKAPEDEDAEHTTVLAPEYAASLRADVAAAFPDDEVEAAGVEAACLARRHESALHGGGPGRSDRAFAVSVLPEMAGCDVALEAVLLACITVGGSRAMLPVMRGRAPLDMGALSASAEDSVGSSSVGSSGGAGLHVALSPDADVAKVLAASSATVASGGTLELCVDGLLPPGAGPCTEGAIAGVLGACPEGGRGPTRARLAILPTLGTPVAAEGQPSARDGAGAAPTILRPGLLAVDPSLAPAIAAAVRDLLLDGSDADETAALAGCSIELGLRLRVTPPTAVTPPPALLFLSADLGAMLPAGFAAGQEGQPRLLATEGTMRAMAAAAAAAATGARTLAALLGDAAAAATIAASIGGASPAESKGGAWRIPVQPSVTSDVTIEVALVAVVAEADGRALVSQLDVLCGTVTVNPGELARAAADNDSDGNDALIGDHLEHVRRRAADFERSPTPGNAAAFAAAAVRCPSRASAVAAAAPILVSLAAVPHLRDILPPAACAATLALHHDRVSHPAPAAAGSAPAAVRRFRLAPSGHIGDDFAANDDVDDGGTTGDGGDDSFDGYLRVARVELAASAFAGRETAGRSVMLRIVAEPASDRTPAPAALALSSAYATAETIVLVPAYLRGARSDYLAGEAKPSEEELAADGAFAYNLHLQHERHWLLPLNDGARRLTLRYAVLLVDESAAAGGQPDVIAEGAVEVGDPAAIAAAPDARTGTEDAHVAHSMTAKLIAHPLARAAGSVVVALDYVVESAVPAEDDAGIANTYDADGANEEEEEEL